MANHAFAPSRSAAARRWRTFLEMLSLVVAVEIALHSFIVREPATTLVAAALWIAGFFWTRRGGLGGPILLGVLALLELVGTIFFSSELAAGAAVPPWLVAVHIVLTRAVLTAVVA